MNNADFNIHLGEDVQVNRPSYSGVQNWSCYYPKKNYGHLDLITSGNIEIHYEGKKYLAGANTILCIPKNREYFFKVSGNYSYYSFFFEYTTNRENDEFILPLCIKPLNTQYFHDKYKRAYNLYIIKSWGYKVKIQELFFDVLSKLNEEYFSISNFNGNYTIKKSMDYIHNNFAKPDLNQVEIADCSNISDTHFRRIFKSVYGVTPVKYISNLRVNKAKVLLRDTNASLEDISQRCGYNDYSYFSRVFTKITGKTPSEYRSEHASEEIPIQ